MTEYIKRRKRFAMYGIFGTVKNVCGNCCHLKGEKGSYRKCEVYGISSSEATDWALSWQACGAFNRIDIKQRNLYKSLSRMNKVHDEPIKGQIGMEIENG